MVNYNENELGDQMLGYVIYIASGHHRGDYISSRRVSTDSEHVAQYYMDHIRRRQHKIVDVANTYLKKPWWRKSEAVQQKTEVCRRHV